MSFVHLHNHTHYSLLDGLTKIDEFIAKAKEQGCPALAITDHGVMYGAIEFYKKCKKAGIKPIIGVELYVAPNSRHDKNTKDDAKNYHILLLAKNNIGYKNLIKLVSLAHLEGFYYKPRVDWELLQKYHEGIICSTACLGGEIPRLISADRLEQAKQKILDYNNLFGQDHFYLELMDHPELDGLEKVNKQLIKFSKELNIPLIVTNDIHYLDKGDNEAQDILLCLQNKKKIEDDDRMKMIGNYSCRDPKELADAFKDVPDAISNTVRIAEMCDLEIELDNVHLPHFEVPKDYNQNSYLKKLCEDGLSKRYPNYSQSDLIEYKKIMDYELGVIEKMGWPSYFLIVAEFVNWAKDRKIVVGPGRGSAAGSLVCYLTGITNLDPIKYELLFERFLNPDRVSMPDIDLDFADVRRDEVIRYVEEKYGKDNVSQIITFGTMAARAAVRDVGRVLDVPYDYCDKLAKMIPMNYKIKDALEKIVEVQDIYKKEETARKILDYAKKLEGVSRHASTHACGVLITKEPLVEYTPLQYASSSDKSIVSQYSLHPVEDLGLLKMDFLGLKNLTIIESAIKIIKNTREVEIDIDKIPLEDKKTFSIFKKGETTGVFQFESGGMRRYLKELKPSEFEDIIAMVALYRPGPMEWIPDYIKGKHGINKTVYIHSKLEPILKKTYGVAIYQEQVMEISRQLAGFSKGEADTLRKAMGKKIPELLAEQKQKFVDGCVKNSIAKNLAEKIFAFIEPFAGYGFNRSHAACYAMIGYQTAYLKAHYPAEFMAALLTADQNDLDRISIEIEECRKFGIEIAPPDVNESFASFTVVTSGTKENKAVDKNEEIKTIRFGLNAIKNVGSHIVEEIIKERKKNGRFQDIFDFLQRIVDKDLNKKSLESLIKCGAFDQFESREILLGNLELLLNFNKESSKSKNSPQVSLFSLNESVVFANPKLENQQEISDSEKLQWEKELLGLYVSEHPFNAFKDKLSSSIIPLAELKDKKNANVLTAGVVSSIKKINTKKNESMLFVKIEDALSYVEVIVFPKALKESLDVWKDGATIILNASVSDKDGEIKLLLNKVSKLDLENLEEVLKEFKNLEIKPRRQFNGNYNNFSNNKVQKLENKSLGINIKNELSQDVIIKIKNILEKYPGKDSVFMKIKDNQGDKIIKTDFLVDSSSSAKDELKKELSEFIDIV